MRRIFNKSISLLLSFVMIASVCYFSDFAQPVVQAARASDITLNGVTLSREAKTNVCTKKLDSGEKIDYEFTYYDYTAVLNNPSITGATDYFSNMKQSHPRLLIDDFGNLLDKIDNDYVCALNYKELKAEADKLLSVQPCSFYLNQRDNINDFSSKIESRVIMLSFVYNIEREKTELGRADATTDYVKYAERAVEELLAAAEYPHWSVNAFLCTAEVADAFAFGYDWLYYYLSKSENAEAKKKIEEAVYKQAIVPFLYNYVVEKTGTDFAYTGMNWNPVCNGSAIVIGMAFYNQNDTSGKYSTICQYLTERGAEALWKGMGQYADGGFYREGSSYWSYATQYMVRAVAAYEFAANEGYTLPERYTHILAPGVSDTPDFPIYMNGIYATFDFGDCSSGHQLDPSIIWIGNRFDKPEYGSYYNTMKQLYNKVDGSKSAVYTILWSQPENASFEVLENLPVDMAHVSESDVNILSMRSEFEVNTSSPNSAFVAMQGGQNLANHMGCHVGTFVLDMGGKRFVKQLPNGNYAWDGYNGGANSKAKWYVRRAEGNNTLIVDPADATTTMDQATNAFAKIVDSGTSDTTGFGIMDLTSTNAKFEKWHRGVMITDNRQRVIIQDEIKPKSTTNGNGRFNDIYWFAHIGTTECVISEDGKTATLTNGNVSINAKITKGPGKFELVDAVPLPTSPNPTEQQSKDYGKKLQIHMTNIGSVTNIVEFAPVSKSDNMSYVALENWETCLSEDEVGSLPEYALSENYETDWYDAKYSTFYLYDDKDLAGLAHMVNHGTDFAGKTVKLVNDITLNSALRWNPIGTQNYPFNGIFDGSQMTISGANFTDEDASYIGLFGYTNNATIKNLKIDGFNFAGKGDVGALAAQTNDTDVINVFVDNTTLRAEKRLGGIIGVQYGGSIKNSGVNAKVFGSGTTYGGIAGYASGVIDNCCANAQLCENVNDSNQGVIVGNNRGGLVGISACGDVKNSYYNYVTVYCGKGTQPLGDNSVNKSNSLGKFASNLTLTNISGTESVLGYIANGKNIPSANNAWIAAQANATDYVAWVSASGSIGNYAKLSFEPETVVDQNNVKDTFLIGSMSIDGSVITVSVQNENITANAGYLVVCQNKTDGTSSTTIIALDMNAKASQSYTVNVLSGASVKAFVLDSFFSMKIKSNTAVL